ncbi:MAG: F0F1 ATP synthase subunit epsilon [Gammaproteobacteria bacterium]|nr:F0F1 ATP synthase subunit epsilon [Gammaproteobacteria bacterium]
MATIQVEIVSAEGEIFSGTAEMVVAPARLGEVGIAPRHAPMLTNLKPGEVRVKVPNEAEEKFFYVTGGILEVQPHLVTVLADSALHAEQLDEQAAMEARQAAEEAMKGATGKEDIAHAQEQLIEAAARYRAAQKLKGKR